MNLVEYKGCQTQQTLVKVRTMKFGLGFPGSTSGKGPACQCRRSKRYEFDP